MTEPNQRGGTRRFYARSADRTFQAYKWFLECMSEALGIAQDLSEDELRRGCGGPHGLSTLALWETHRSKLPKPPGRPEWK